MELILKSDRQVELLIEALCDYKKKLYADIKDIDNLILDAKSMRTRKEYYGYTWILVDKYISEMQHPMIAKEIEQDIHAKFITHIRPNTIRTILSINKDKKYFTKKISNYPTKYFNKPF